MNKLISNGSIFLALFLAGCSSINGTDVSMSGAGVLLDNTSSPYSPENLACLISSITPKDSKDSNITPGCRIVVANQQQNSNSDDKSLEQAIAGFGNALYSAGSNSPTALRQMQMRDARNEILGVLLAASENRCIAFKLQLREASSNTSFALGSLATSLGAAGAIFKNSTSRVLSGLSGATSGVNAEYNKDIMSSVTSSVIIPGINKERSARLQTIANRRCLGVPSYPLSLALSDVAYYHAACSTDVGVAAASAAISDSPHTQSLAEVKQTIDAVKSLSDTLNANGQDKGGSAQNQNSSTAGKKKNPQAADDNTGQTATNLPATVTSSTSSSSEANKDNNTSNPPLVGTAVDIQECQPLDANGLVTKPATATKGATSTSSGSQKPSVSFPGKPIQSLY